jgi:outer membrane autotransporter protein
LRVGIAAGTVEGQTWAPGNGNASNSTAQFATYGQWQRGMFFAKAQLDLMYQQETVHQTLPLFGTNTRGDTDGLAGGGGLRVGVQQHLGAWLIEPSLGFGGFDLQMDRLTETGGALAETIGGATLGSAESTLGVSAQRDFALSPTMRMTVRGQLGWSHEFADNTANISEGFAGLSGSGFAVTSAPIGRDAAVVGLGADLKGAAWPVAMFVGYGGAFSGSSEAQSFNAGVRFAW